MQGLLFSGSWAVERLSGCSLSLTNVRGHGIRFNGCSAEHRGVSAAAWRPGFVQVIPDRVQHPVQTASSSHHQRAGLVPIRGKALFRFGVLFRWLVGVAASGLETAEAVTPSPGAVCEGHRDGVGVFAWSEGPREPVIHRDVKAANVVIAPDGRCVLIDFGLALEAKEVRSRGAGTLSWMSPEALGVEKDLSDVMDVPVLISVLKDNLLPAVTVATDMWSFGCVLIEILTGLVPWKGLTEAEIKQRMSQGLVPPEVLLVEGELVELVEGCLKIGVTDRWTAEDALKWIVAYSQVCALWLICCRC